LEPVERAEKAFETNAVGRAPAVASERLLHSNCNGDTNDVSTETDRSERASGRRRARGVAAVTGLALQFGPELFPRGVTQYAVGGVLVAAGIAVIYLGTAIIPGNSTFLETTLSYVSDLPRFQRAKYVASRDWRVVFAVSIVAGAAAWGLVLDPGAFTTAVQPWRLFVGGVLVGIGTRVGKGCTAGHGVCGLGSASRTSFVNVALFVGVAIATAAVVAAAGVTP
jgi:hypothetical protein